MSSNPSLQALYKDELVTSVAEALDLEHDHCAFARELTRLAVERFVVSPEAAGPLTVDLFLLLCALRKSEEGGSTLLPFAQLPEILRPLLETATVTDAFPECADRMAALGRGELAPILASRFCSASSELAYTPLVAFSSGVALQRLAFQEQRIAVRLAELLGGEHDGESIKTTDAPLLNTDLGEGRSLNREQAEAVSRALLHRVALVSGGPGTGKTSIAASIVAALLHRNLDPASIALTAPTGKAAHRLGSSVAKSLGLMGFDNATIALLPEAATLHRLLGYNPTSDTFRHNRQNPLACNAILVDESSMVDLHIFERMLDALPSHARLILLGDANQLPSVEVGSVFRDLIERPQLSACATTLRESFRMRAADAGKGRNILMVANGIIEGRSPRLVSPTETESPGEDIDSCVPMRSTIGDLRWSGVEFLATPTTEGPPARLLLEWLRALHTDCAGEPDLLERRKILCFTRVGPFGSEAVNQLLARRFAELTRQPSGRFHVGEPIIVTQNDYVRGLFNGDNGIVMRNAGTGGLDAMFPRPHGTPITVPLQAVQHMVEHAFAITVHKSQGSEYERTIILLPSENSPFATRDLLYTALTRSSRSSLLVGSPEILRQVAARKLIRHSLLSLCEDW
jgi:exodeoxyribonuclease V alpha subunit